MPFPVVPRVGSQAGRGRQRLLLRAQLLDLRFKPLDLLFHVAQQVFGLAAEGRQREGLELLPLDGQFTRQLVAPPDHLGKLHLLGRRRRRGLRLPFLTVGGQHGGIHGIGLGALAGGLREFPHAGGIEDADNHPVGVQRRHDGAFVAAGGFADDVDARVGGQEPEQAAVAGGGYWAIDTTAQLDEVAA